MCWVPGTDMDNFVDFVDDLDVWVDVLVLFSR
jgi:hypothetical protein